MLTTSLMDRSSALCNMIIIIVFPEMRQYHCPCAVIQSWRTFGKVSAQSRSPLLTGGSSRRDDEWT